MIKKRNWIIRNSESKFFIPVIYNKYLIKFLVNLKTKPMMILNLIIYQAKVNPKVNPKKIPKKGKKTTSYFNPPKRPVFIYYILEEQAAQDKYLSTD